MWLAGARSATVSVKSLLIEWVDSGNGKDFLGRDRKSSVWYILGGCVSPFDQSRWWGGRAV